MSVQIFVLVAVIARLAISQAFERWTYDDIHPPTCIEENNKSDHRIYKYDTRRNSLPQYQHNGIFQYVQLEIDYDNDQLLIGSRETIYRVKLSNLNFLQKDFWPLDNENKTSCLQKGLKYCSNYVTVLKKSGQEVLVCSSNIKEGTCHYRNITDIKSILRPTDGYSLHRFQPDQETTVLVTSDLSVFSGAFYNRIQQKPMIIRYSRNPEMKELITEKDNYRWFNSPSFVASFELGDYVYIFFRETAVECLGCGERIVSRIARICKNDPGIGNITFATYAKARLNCSLPGDVPFYFDQIQSVDLQREEEQFYAVFTAPPLQGSAICVYNLSSIEKTFKGAYKKPSEINCHWVKENSIYNKTCNNPPPVLFYEKKNASALIIMNEEVQPTLIGPLVYSPVHRWNHIQVDRVWTLRGNHSVIFVSTDRNHIQKFLVHTENTDQHFVCLVESIRFKDLTVKNPF